MTTRDLLKAADLVADLAFGDQSTPRHAVIGEVCNAIRALAAQEQEQERLAYPTIEDYEQCIGCKTNEAFRIGWVMARTAMKHLNKLSAAPTERTSKSRLKRIASQRGEPGDTVRQAPAVPPATMPVDWPECREFYELMQRYRHVNHTCYEGEDKTVEAYESVKAWLRTHAEALRECFEDWRNRAEVLQRENTATGSALLKTDAELGDWQQRAEKAEADLAALRPLMEAAREVQAEGKWTMLEELKTLPGGPGNRLASALSALDKREGK